MIRQNYYVHYFDRLLGMGHQDRPPPPSVNSTGWRVCGFYECVATNGAHVADEYKIPVRSLNPAVSELLRVHYYCRGFIAGNDSMGEIINF